MNEGLIEYPSVSVGVRPPRALVTWQADTVPWVATARRAIASVSRIWGGSGFVIAPVTQTGIHEALLPVLRSFDPDYVLEHITLFRDLNEDDPSFKADFLARQKLEGVDLNQVWDQIKDDPASLASDQSSLADQIDTWCSPFTGPDSSTRKFEVGDVHWFNRNESPNLGLTAINDAAIETAYVPDLSTVDPLIALMLETRIGSIEPSRTVRTVSVNVGENEVPALVSLAISGTLGSHDWQLREAGAIEERLAEPQSFRSIPFDTFIAGTPFAHTNVGLAQVGSYGTMPTVCVIGDTPDDYALAMLYDRLYGHAAWVPRQVLEHDKGISTAAWRAMLALRRKRHQDRKPVLLTSTSESFEYLEELASKTTSSSISINGVPTPVSPTMEAVRPQDISGQGRVFLADQKSFDRRLSVPCRRDDSGLTFLAAIEPPTPVAADVLDNLAWCTEVTVPGQQVPAKAAISSDAVSSRVGGGWPEAVVRVTRQGLAYSSINMGFVQAGASPDARRAKPILRFPSALSIFTELAKRLDVVVQPSPAGRRAMNCIDLWGSLSALQTDLKGPVRRILDAFIPPKSMKTGDYKRGYAVRSRGFLNMAHVTKALGDADESHARDLIDQLLGRKILRRGLLLTCERCSAQDFYPLRALSDDGFTCAACSHLSSISRRSWYKGDIEPTWNYALDQVVSELIGQNGDVPLLAAAKLAENARAFDWAPELDLSWDGDSAELDLALIVDGRVVVGEAKSNNTLKTSDKGTEFAARRLVDAARRVGADEIILATSKPAWSASARTAVESAIEEASVTGWRSRVVEVVNATG